MPQKGTQNTTSKKHKAATGTASARSQKNSSGKSRSGNTSGGSRKASGKSSGRKQIDYSGQNPIDLNGIVILISIAVFLYLMLSVFGHGGTIGNSIRTALFGIFGILAYIVPVILWAMLLFCYFNPGNPQVPARLSGGVLLFVAMEVLLSAMSYGASPEKPAAAYLDGTVLSNLGGFLGGSLLYLMEPAISLAVIYVINILLIIIAVILLTGFNLTDLVDDGQQNLQDKAVERQHRRELEKEERQTARQRNLQYKKELLEQEHADRSKDQETRAEMDRRAKQRSVAHPGVGMNITVGPEGGITGKGNMTELHLPPQEAPTPKADSPARVSRKKIADSKPAASAEVRDPVQYSIEDYLSDDGEGILYQSAYPENPAEASPSQKSGLTEQPSDDMLSEAHEDQQNSLSQEGAVPREEALPQEEAVPAQEVRKRRTHESAADRQHGIDDVQRHVNADKAAPVQDYLFPDIELLARGKGYTRGNAREREIQETAKKLERTLHDFNVNATVTNYSCGPAVTRFEITPDIGVKVNKIVALTNDLKLALAAADIRIEAPIPGKSAVGIEVPNPESTTVCFRDLIESDEYEHSQSKLTFAVGMDISGKVKVADIAKMPHLLIAGATGSGKSVCINTIIMSILYKARPDEVKMIMIDPKVVELSVYNGIPHLMIPVVTDPKKAAGALNWAVKQMTDRYQLFAENHVRDIKGYNAYVEKAQQEEGKEPLTKMPLIVIIVDELADLMMVASKDVEEAICRLAQLARAAGIHLIIATQRPSVNVITGLIKANMPSRIAFAVTSGVDSRTILDMNGAEKLLGKGDMLFDPQGAPKPMRVQGAFISDDEVQEIVNDIKNKNQPGEQNEEIQKQMNALQSQSLAQSLGQEEQEDGRDPLFADAGRLLVKQDKKASIGMLQRYLKIGFNRAARIMDQLQEAGVVGAEEGTKPRTVLMSPEQFENYLEQNG